MSIKMISSTISIKISTQSLLPQQIVALKNSSLTKKFKMKTLTQVNTLKRINKTW